MNSFDAGHFFQQGFERLVRYAKGIPIKVEVPFSYSTNSASNMCILLITSPEMDFSTNAYVSTASKGELRKELDKIKDTYLKPYKRLRRLSPEQLILLVDAPEPHVARIARHLIKEAK